uniref:Uncharacterized protein n=1 Tax=Anguilla anguilla TaxID=7936 RepID=A0A0E9VNB3_ANGAN
MRSISVMQDPSDMDCEYVWVTLFDDAVSQYELAELRRQLNHEHVVEIHHPLCFFTNKLGL